MKAKGDWNIEDFFVDRPEGYVLFSSVRRLIESFGPVKVEAMKTQISFGTATKFAWVWLPQRWIKKRPANSITVAFAAGRHITNARIEEAVEPYPGRWTHHVIIQKESELDDDFRNWLLEAYRFSQRKIS